MKHLPISERLARGIFHKHFTGKLPAGMHWYAIEGLTINTSVFDASFLIAGEDGLYGIVGFRDESVVQVEPIAELGAAL